MPENSSNPADNLSLDNAHLDSVHLDTSGLNCPEPVMMLHQAIRKSQSGQIIHVVATDPSTTRDIPKFCLHLGHELIGQHQQDNNGKTQYLFEIRKK